MNENKRKKKKFEWENFNLSTHAKRKMNKLINILIKKIIWIIHNKNNIKIIINF